MDITERFKLHNLIVLRTIGKGTYGNVYLCEKQNKKSLAVVKDIELNTKLQNHNKEILFYFSQVLLGVRYIHNLDIIHRDLKAENILLTGTHGVIVKIGDFGISKMLASAKKTSTVIGTPYYLAPELCEGKPYDTKSDVWALGCLLYEMCTHKRAFDSESLVGLVKVITSGNVHPIDMTVYDRGLQDLVDSMLSVIPEKRPTIKELLGRPILLPTVYTVYLDAGNDELLYSKFCKCF
ncbi:PREDICTED: serine/threonine-protein kinase Nek8 isoform X2 [Papilio polytes]|uniref:serine/threonine-protein kinase Nek8 isoform X2 n=1 Tax=Papilio polytes TaxID=76194 RepID=UPI0006769C19|nr:PREDICTED: serine/threonine-protein kinase Nek8 isoform X2 [Papilio polytes]